MSPKDKCIEALHRCANNADTEKAHIEADDAICEFLKSIGHSDIVDAFDDVQKWYA